MEPYVYYLSGPMSGIADHNFPLFARVAKHLRDSGLEIRSPHESQPITDHGTDLPYEDYIRKDIQIMMECNAIILLPGWTLSRGARIEFNIALDLKFLLMRVDVFASGITIDYLDDVGEVYA